MLVSFGATIIFFITIILPILHFFYGTLFSYDAESFNLYLPETLWKSYKSINKENGFVTNVLLVILFSGEIIYRIITDVIRSVHFSLPRNLAGLRMRQANGELLSASLMNALDCRVGRCNNEEPTDEYYVRIGLHRVCVNGKKHGIVEDTKAALGLLRIVDDFQKQEKILYALANVALAQTAMGISIKEFDHVSGADTYTRSAFWFGSFFDFICFRPYFQIKNIRQTQN